MGWEHHSWEEKPQAHKAAEPNQLPIKSLCTPISFTAQFFGKKASDTCPSGLMIFALAGAVT